MKLYIDLIDSEGIEKQLESVLEYVRKNKLNGSWRLETTKEFGVKVFTIKGSNHVSCKETKNNNYSFKVWRAV